MICNPVMPNGSWGTAWMHSMPDAANEAILGMSSRKTYHASIHPGAGGAARLARRPATWRS